MTADPARTPAAANDPDDATGQEAIYRLLDRPPGDEQVRQATERIALPRPQSAGDTISLLLFQAGGERFAVPAAEVARVTRIVVVRRIPHRSNHIIRGLCNVDGELLICGSLTALLEWAEADPTAISAASGTESRRMIVLGTESDRWAFEVDQVQGVQYFESSSFKTPPVTVQQARSRLTTALVPLGGDDVATLLDVAQVLSGLRRALS